ncbi:response regulator [Sulfurimonas lithotrophica]|uniref:histidine kinase n=1 Tax=Sulfurimonas lithotrophica TaxID=2590022 RepID=A0A5P8NZB1_9BACT|nr:ABC transporter substrate-binding protein [Sulfurimonas lithotrophica]QFR48761.1 response regulator [Sulfurimonas lithotrophica]
MFLKINFLQTILFLLFYVSCLNANNNNLEKVSLQLNGLSTFEFAGYYMALKNGYYKEAGLDVKILERNFNKNNIDQVINGEATYSISDSNILLYRSYGHPVQVMASIFQHSPLVLISAENTMIFSPLEMNNKIISYPEATDNAAVSVLLSSSGLKKSDYTYIPFKNDYKDFLEGKIDVISGHSGRIIFDLLDEDVDFNIINPVNYGVDLYDGILFSREKELKNNPERSKKFLAASIKGWNYAMDNKELSAKTLIDEYGSKSTLDALLYEANLYEKLMVRKLVDIGYTNSDRFYKAAQAFEKMDKSDKDSLKQALKELVWNPNTDKPNYEKYLNILLIFVIVVIIIIFSLLLFSKKLKDTVDLRTKEINEKNNILKEVQSIAHLGSWNYDVKQKKLDWSDEIFRIIGFQPQSFKPNENTLLSYVHPDDFKHVQKARKKSMTDKQQCNIEYKILRDDGDIRYVQENIIHSFNAKGNLVKSIGTIYDITKTILHEKELKEQTKKAMESNIAKSEFLANMSHEIRTPLNAIMGFIDLLKEKERDSESLKYLGVINSASNDLLNIINDILDFSKIESGNITIDSINFNPKNEFLTTKKLFEARANEKNIILYLTINELPKILKGDVLRIKQVLNNLIGNAIKFTAEGKNIFVDIMYYKSQLRVRVKDEGIGISKEYQKRIFEPFSQEDNSTTRKYGGTGLGLSISYNLIKMMGGKLDVKSELNKGSEFYFSIPLETSDEQEDEKPKLSDIKKELEGNILLVEDNKANQMFIKVIFKKEKVTYDIANDGFEAIEYFKNNKYDVILMDENMPNMSGIETTSKIIEIEKKNKLKHTPIIALTANALKGDKKKFLSAGMDYYLTKPVDKNMLRQVLSEYLN